MRKRLSRFFVLLVLGVLISGCVKQVDDSVVSATIIVKRHDIGENVCSMDYDLVNDNDIAVRNCVTILPECGNIQLNAFGIIDANTILDFETTFPCDGETCSLAGAHAICERYYAA